MEKLWKKSLRIVTSDEQNYSEKKAAYTLQGLFFLILVICLLRFIKKRLYTLRCFNVVRLKVSAFRVFVVTNKRKAFFVSLLVLNIDSCDIF